MPVSTRSSYPRSTSVSRFILEKLFTAKDARDTKENKGTSFVIKITNLVIASGFTLALISLASLASLAVQMLDLGSTLIWRWPQLAWLDAKGELGPGHCGSDVVTEIPLRRRFQRGQ